MSFPEEFAAILTRDESLASLTTVRIGGVARFVARPRTEEEVGCLLRGLAQASWPYRVLGGGSNVLADDGDMEEVIIHPAPMDHFVVEGDRVRVGAGLPTARLVNLASDAGLAGVHVLAGIPGQVGGAIAMNAGTRHGWIDSVVERVRVRLGDGRPADLTRQDLAFGYRQATLPEGAVVVEAVLRLCPVEDRGALKRTVGGYLKEKNAVQPTRSWNFGCMFKNPPGASAGVLLDRAGMRGMVRGGARISDIHANFIENLGEARAEDVRWLLAHGTARVWECFGIRLEPEVRVWLPFEGTARTAERGAG